MPIQPCTSENKIEGKNGHSTRSAYDDAALVAHSAQDLKTLLNQFS